MMQHLTTHLFAVVAAPDNIPKTALDNATLTNVLNSAFALAGAVAVIFIIVGALQYAGSQGDSQKVAGAKNTILYAVIGLIVVGLSMFIVNFVIGEF